jgi:two-component system, OmpR family, sensor histidine kinase KdpD
MTTPIRMLILEDRPSDAELILHELKKGGYDPIFRRIETREDFVANLNPSLEIIIADYSMPQFDAIRALKILQEQGFDIPFIVVTGAIGDEIAIECMKEGASDYLLKDRMARLSIAVAHVLEEKKLRDEQKRVEHSLKESEEKFRMLFNNASDGIVIHDMEVRILEVNQAICDRLGYSRDELLQMTIMEIETPDYAAMLKGKIKELLAEQHVFFESAVVHRDGMIIPIELSSRLIEFEGNRAVLSIIRDITVRKRAEEALKRLNAELEVRVSERTKALQEEISERHKAEKELFESRRALGTLISNLPGIAYRCSSRPEGPMEFVSEGCIAITGYRPDDFTCNRVLYSNLILPEDREYVWNTIQKAIGQKQPFTINYRIRDASGEEKWLWEQGCGVFGETGTLLALEGFIVDSTERKRRELEIKQKARELGVINDIVTIISPTQAFPVIYRKSMDKLRKILGFEVVLIYRLNPPRHMFELQYHTGSELPEFVVSGLSNIPIDNEILSSLIFHRNSLYFEKQDLPWCLFDVGITSLAAVPVMTESKVIGIMLAMRSRDEHIIENERRILDELGRKIGEIVEEATLHAELKRLHEESNLYIDILAHDINDANTRSLGYSDILTEMLSGKMKEYALITKKGIEQSIEIIRKVTLIRRIREKTTDLIPVDLDGIIQTEILRNRKIAIFYEPSGISVSADDLISEVFGNLINNSVTYGGPFVTIWIKVEHHEETVEINIVDNGPGIPDNVKSHLFTRSQGNGRETGKGLGLYIVRMLVDRYGGKIRVRDRVENDPSQGLVMTLTLKTAPGTSTKD